MQNVYIDSGVYRIDIYPEESYGLYGYLYIGLGSFICYEIRDISLTSCLLTILERMQMRRIQKTKRRIKLEKRRIDLFMYNSFSESNVIFMFLNYFPF